ncbi:MAG: argininosuccinate lyase [Ktedonobacterales bacterium]
MNAPATSPANKLWAKGYTLDPRVERYEASRNAALDHELARHDIWGSLAHARMLARIGVLSSQEQHAIEEALKGLLSVVAEDDFIVPPGAEDVHTAIEQALVQRVGEPGKKIHTGRSRNDQVLVDLRLAAKEGLHRLGALLVAACDALLGLAERHEWVPMPGYTHMQRAMLSSVGLWASAHAEALLDDAGMLAAAYVLNDQSPLGSAAAYGVPLPLDREYTAEQLGFAQAQHNVLAAQNSRGKAEAAVVQALALVMLDLSKFAQDVLLFTTTEFGFFSVPQELCTGSSIMPQKRNLGALELVRARAQTMLALQQQILGILTGLPSGYNMDYQETKAPFLEALHLGAESLEICALFAGSIHVDENRLRAACTAELFAADSAYALAQEGMPFRDAYKVVAANPSMQEIGDLEARLRARSHLGAPGNLELSVTRAHLEGERAAWQARQVRFDAAIAALTDTTKQKEARI